MKKFRVFQATTTSVDLGATSRAFGLPPIADGGDIRISDSARLMVRLNPDHDCKAFLEIQVDLGLDDDGAGRILDMDSLQTFSQFIMSEGATVEGNLDGAKLDALRDRH